MHQKKSGDMGNKLLIQPGVAESFRGVDSRSRIPVAGARGSRASCELRSACDHTGPCDVARHTR
jgi:hypothetical protein